MPSRCKSRCGVRTDDHASRRTMTKVLFEEVTFFPRPNNFRDDRTTARTDFPRPTRKLRIIGMWIKDPRHHLAVVNRASPGRERISGPEPSVHHLEGKADHRGVHHYWKPETDRGSRAADPLGPLEADRLDSALLVLRRDTQNQTAVGAASIGERAWLQLSATHAAARIAQPTT